MKTSTCQILTIGAALWLAPLTSTLAQANWETTDAASPAAGRDIVADSVGNFIGLNLDYTTTNAITAVIRSSDHGATWQTVGSIGGYALDLTAAPDGALFAAGNRTLIVSGRAVVWQSLDSGATWTQLDPWPGQSGTFLCSDVVAGNNSYVYLSCSVTGLGSWIVRRGERSAAGIVWSTVDNFPGKNAAAMAVRRGAAGQPDEVLVSGSGLVRRSLDSATTWTSIDNYGGTGVVTGPNNSIYTTTHSSTSINVTNWVLVHKKLTAVVTTTSEYGWLVRRSTDGGASWSNVDYFAGGWPLNGGTVDAFGRVFIAGFNDNTTPRTWLVRGSSDGGTTWVTTDSFLPAGATSAQAWAVCSDALGNVCVLGQATIGGLNVAPVRRLAAP